MSMRVSFMQSLKKAGSYDSYPKCMPLHASCAKNEWRGVNCYSCALSRDQLQRDVGQLQRDVDQLQRDILNARGFEVAILNGRVVQQDLSAGRPSDKEHGA